MLAYGGDGCSGRLDSWSVTDTCHLRGGGRLGGRLLAVLPSAMKQLSLVSLLVVRVSREVFVLLLTTGVQLTIAVEATTKPFIFDGSMSRLRRQKVSHLIVLCQLPHAAAQPISLCHRNQQVFSPPLVGHSSAKSRHNIEVNTLTTQRNSRHIVIISAFSLSTKCAFLKGLMHLSINRVQLKC